MSELPGIVYVLIVVAAAAAGVWWGRLFAEAQETHLCVGCCETEVETCQTLCVNCTFDAEHADNEEFCPVCRAGRKSSQHLTQPCGWDER